MLNVSLAKSSSATKLISGSPSDCANIAYNLTMIIDNSNHYNLSGHSILRRPGASAAEESERGTRKITYAAENNFAMSLITKLTLTLTLTGMHKCLVEVLLMKIIKV